MPKDDKDLFEVVSRVHDEDSFIEFLQALAVDRQNDREEEAQNPSSQWGASPRGWENGSIEDFLGAAAAWATASMNGLPLMEKESNPWKRAAQIIHSGKFYE